VSGGAQLCNGQLPGHLYLIVFAYGCSLCAAFVYRGLMKGQMGDWRAALEILRAGERLFPHDRSIRKALQVSELWVQTRLNACVLSLLGKVLRLCVRLCIPDACRFSPPLADPTGR
jgi:hypothetical protein